MSLIRAHWLNLSDNFLFTGSVMVPTPTVATQATNKGYVDALTNSVSTFETEDLAYTDTVHKVIALTYQVGPYTDVAVFALNGPPLLYGVDYTIRKNGTQAYICIDPISSNPAGGSFTGGDPLNPTVGVSFLLFLNDEVKVAYSTNGLGGAAAGFQGPQGAAGTPGGPQGLTGIQGHVGVQGVPGLQGPLPFYPGLSVDTTGTTTDSPVSVYSKSSASGIVSLTMFLVNTDGSNSLDYTATGTFIDNSSIPGGNGTIVPGGFVNLGAPSIASGLADALNSVDLSVQSTVSGTPATYALHVRGIETIAAGPQGLTGPQGTGPQGTTGAVGGTGAVGPMGVQGIQGSLGMQGWSGVQGLTGSTGTQGLTGAKGFQGVAGTGGTNAQSTAFTDTTGNSSLVEQMEGIGLQFTPSATGKFFVIVTGNTECPTAAGGAQIKLRYGTGTPPTIGASPTGTPIGSTCNAINPQVSGATLSQVCKFPFAIQGVITGLSIGTTYWADISLVQTNAAPSTAFVYNVIISTIEL